MNMINGLKMKQWGFKFGSSKESNTTSSSSSGSSNKSLKRVYQREVVKVNGASATKVSVVQEISEVNQFESEEEKVITQDGPSSMTLREKIKSYERNGACVKDVKDVKDVKNCNDDANGKDSVKDVDAKDTVANLRLNNHAHFNTRPDAKPREKAVERHERSDNSKNVRATRCDAASGLNGLSNGVNGDVNADVKKEDITDTVDCDNANSNDKGTGAVSLGKVNDRVEVVVDGSDLSDDDCLDDNHGLNICHYKLKRMALDQNNMNHSKVHVDESEPTGHEEVPFESRDVKIRNGCWTDEYEISEVLLGRGKFGEVKQCKEKKTGRDLAAKFIEIQGPQDRFDVINEIEMMKSLQHPRLLQLYDVFSKRNNFCLVLELISGGELFERVINDDFILTEKACIMFMRQICEGIEFMHNNSIIHLDLKPENILCLTREGNRIKIIDFGLARKYDPKTELRILFGTPEFMAPEQANFEPIYPSTDMWSVGIICYILLSGLSPFLGENENETIANITEAKWDFNAEEFDSVSAEAKDFIGKLILKDHTKRITATECLEHKWLRRSAKRERIPTRSLSTKRLRKFVYRRKWQKAVNAMLALKRMGVKL